VPADGPVVPLKYRDDSDAGAAPAVRPLLLLAKPRTLAAVGAQAADGRQLAVVLWQELGCSAATGHDRPGACRVGNSTAISKRRSMRSRPDLRIARPGLSAIASALAPARAALAQCHESDSPVRLQVPLIAPGSKHIGGSRIAGKQDPRPIPSQPPTADAGPVSQLAVSRGASPTAVGARTCVYTGDRARRDRPMEWCGVGFDVGGLRHLRGRAQATRLASRIAVATGLLSELQVGECW